MAVLSLTVYYAAMYLRLPEHKVDEYAEAVFSVPE